MAKYSNDQNIKSAVEKYKLQAAGHELWTPYAINEPGVAPGPLQGKGSPAQIQVELNRIVSEYQDPLHNGEEVRYLMLRNGLGIDCSGFVYHALAIYLQASKGVNLAEQLMVYKREVEQAREKTSWREKISDEEMRQLPEQIRLSQLCRKLDKRPSNLVNVARLCDQVAADTIGSRPAELRPGDMLRFGTDYGDHIGLVTEVTERQITYASSDFDPTSPGGVAFHEIKITDSAAGLENQDWSRRAQFSGAYRLKALA